MALWLTLTKELAARGPCATSKGRSGDASGEFGRQKNAPDALRGYCRSCLASWARDRRRSKWAQERAEAEKAARAARLVVCKTCGERREPSEFTDHRFAGEPPFPDCARCRAQATLKRDVGRIVGPPDVEAIALALSYRRRSARPLVSAATNGLMA